MINDAAVARACSQTVFTIASQSDAACGSSYALLARQNHARLSLKAQSGGNHRCIEPQQHQLSTDRPVVSAH